MKSIAITSGKGGVGKSFLTTNLGWILAASGRKTIVFDADLQLANLDILFGASPVHSLQHVVAGQVSLRDALHPIAPDLHLISGGSALPSLMSAGPKRMATFFDQMEELGSDHDFILFDTGAGLDSRVLAFLKFSREILVVTTPDPSAVSDAYAIVKVIFNRKPDAVVSLIVNEVSHEREAIAVARTLQDTVVTFLGKAVGFSGWVRQDSAAAASVRNRRPLASTDLDGKAVSDIAEIARRMQLSEGDLRRPA
ncbi:MAG: AAA family ATPase [Fimbriimonadaceae bacterium]|jgi:flagellar biosynthesis protein FlhG|nr:AAA family ATPase [Fimbriimonadaceae bacterium]